MLDLGFDINLNIRKTHMPIYFAKKNICVHCGANNSLVFVDKFGRNTNKEINAFDHIKCKECGKIYSIRWEHGIDGKMYPSAIEYDITKQFLRFVGLKKNPKNANNDFD